MQSIHSGYWVHVPSCLVPLLSHGIVLHLVLVFSAGQESQTQSSPFHPYFWNLDPSLQICFHLREGKQGFMWLAAVNLKEGEKGKGWEDWGGDKQYPPYFNPSGFLWGCCGLTGQPGLELLLALDHFGQTDLLIARRRASCTSPAKTTITKLHYLGNLHNRKRCPHIPTKTRVPIKVQWVWLSLRHHFFLAAATCSTVSSCGLVSFLVCAQTSSSSLIRLDWGQL